MTLARYCTTPGCVELATNGNRCPAHAAARRRSDNHRRNTRMVTRIYRDARWRKTRQTVLERDRVCQLCGGPPTIADHYPTPALRLHDPYDPKTCRALCHSCSGREDGKRSRGVGVVSRTQTPPNPIASNLLTENVSGVFCA